MLANVAMVVRLATAPVRTASAVVAANRKPVVAAMLANVAMVARLVTAPVRTASAVIAAKNSA